MLKVSTSVYTVQALLLCDNFLSQTMYVHNFEYCNTLINTSYYNKVFIYIVIL